MKQGGEQPFVGQEPKKLISNLAELTQGQHIVDFVHGHLFVAMAAGVPLFLVWAMAWLLPVLRSWQERSKALAHAALAEVAAALIVLPMVELIFTSIIDRNIIWLAMAGA